MRVEEPLQLVEIRRVLDVGPVDPLGPGRVEDVFPGERTVEDRVLTLVGRGDDRSGDIGEDVGNGQVRRGYPLRQRDVVRTVLPLPVLGDMAGRRRVGDHHAAAARRVILVEAREPYVPGQLHADRTVGGVLALGRVVAAGVENENLHALDGRQDVEDLVDGNAADVDVVEGVGLVVHLDQVVPANPSNCGAKSTCERR